MNSRRLIRSPRRRGRAAIGGTVEAERLRSLQVDDHFEFGRCLHREVGRLFAFEDAIDIAGGAPKLVDSVGPVGDQAAGGDEELDRVDRGQSATDRQGKDQIAMKRNGAVGPARSGPIRAPREG